MASAAIQMVRSHAITFLIGAALSLLWVVILAARITGDLPVIGWFAFLFVVAISASSGLRLKLRLATTWTATVPRYRSAHMWTVLSFWVFCLALNAGIVMYRGVPATFAILLWTYGLISLLCAYFCLNFNTPGRAIVAMGLFALMLVTTAALLDNHLFKLPWELAPVLFIVNAGGTWFGVRKMKTIEEDTFLALDYKNPQQAVRAIWAAMPDKSIVIWDRVIKSEWPSGFFAQLRYVEQAFVPPTDRAWRVLPFAALVFLVYRFFSDNTAWVVWLTLMVPPGIFTQATQNMQRFFMLPLSRKQLVKKGGATLAFMQARVWIGCAIVCAIANFGRPVLPMIMASLALQIPLFACVMGLNSIRKVRDVSAVVPMVLTAAMAASEGYSLTQTAYYSAIVSLVIGPVLIAISYYRWLTVELD